MQPTYPPMVGLVALGAHCCYCSCIPLRCVSSPVVRCYITEVKTGKWNPALCAAGGMIKMAALPLLSQPCPYEPEARGAVSHRQMTDRQMGC